ncbi:MAG: penicillin amidase [Candidatus Hydrogenedentota bacterium]|nr:MAG: penicillin amidase [Candidatus Hydrogenedentota bacterium]
MNRSFTIIVTVLMVTVTSLSAHAVDASKYDVRILRDNWGVPHIYGKTDADVGFGLAYAHSEDNFKIMQESLMTSRGMMGLYSGQSGALTDYIVHLLGTVEAVEEKYESDLSPELRAVLEAYAEGVNFYGETHPDEILLEGLLPVTGKDIAAGFAFRAPFFFGLDRAVRELYGDERRKEVSEKKASLPGEFTVAEAFDAAHHFVSQGMPMGSNGTSVSPNRSSDGSTFLLVNPHLSWEGQTAWYEVHVHSEEGWNMTGGLFPGSAVITLGHNENLGWTHTVNAPDLVDTYVLEMNPDNPDQYKFDGEWLDLEKKQISLKVKVTEKMFMPVRRELLYSIHGPVIRADHGVYAIRYAGRGDIRSAEQWYRMNKATNLEEFQKAVRMQGVHSFNTIYADKEGNIWSLYNALIPKRAEGYDWQQYLPGNTSDTLWTEYLPFDDLPQVLNPKNGFVQNNNSTPFLMTFGPEAPREEDFSKTLGIETRITNRTLRALELFEADESITWDEFVAYKFDLFYSKDYFVVKAKNLLLNGPEPEEPIAKEAMAILRAWDLGTQPDNTSTALAVTTFNSTASRNALNLEDKSESYTLLLNALIKTAQTLKDHYGRIDIPWEQFNRLKRGDVEVGLGGGPDILHCVTPRYNEDRSKSYARHGDGVTFLVAWDKDGKVSSRSFQQYGQSMHEDSKHWADQVELIRTRTTKPVLFTEADIRANLEREYRPGE